MVKMENYSCQEHIQELWLKIDHLHMSYLEMEESPEKIDHRSKLEACIEDFLCITSPEQKFVLPEIEEVLYKSAVNKKDFSGYKAATGFNAIQMYAGNLLSQPWRKEYYQVKTYCGFYKHQVEANLLGAEKIFEAMGYKHTGNGILVLDGPICPDRVAHVSRDCLIAYVECQIIKHIWEEVSPMFNISWLDVLEFRRAHLSDPKQCIKFLQYNLNQRHHYQGTPGNFHLKYPTTVSHGQIPMQNGNSYNSFSVHNHPTVSPQPAVPYNVCMNGCCPHMYPTCNYLPYTPHLAALKRSPPTILPHNGSYYGNGYPVTSSSCPYPVPTAQLIEVESQNGYDVVDAPTVSSRSRKTALHSHDMHEFNRPNRNGEVYRNDIKNGENDEFENWDYVYRNLESQGYSKDLGERGDILSAGNKQRKQSRELRHKPTNLDEAMNNLAINDRHLKTNEADISPKVAEKLNLPIKERKHSQSSSYDNLPSKESQVVVKTSTNLSSEAASHNRSLKDVSAHEIAKPTKTIDVQKNKEIFDTAERSKWECKSCTYINTTTKDICEMCSKSRDIEQEQPIEVGGAECSKCTLVNPKSAKICQACSSSLKDSPTYI